jgi:hypothetical protein
MLSPFSNRFFSQDSPNPIEEKVKSLSSPQEFVLKAQVLISVQTELLVHPTSSLMRPR